MEWALSIVGVIVGAVVGWSWATARARSQSSAELGELQNQLGTANGTLEETRAQIVKNERTLADLRQSLDEERTARTATQERLDATQADKKELKDTFTVLSAEALDKNSERFIKQAEERIKPLREALEKFQKQTGELEATRHKAMGGVSAQLDAISLTHKELQQETRKLVAALRRPGSKGRWGEMQLRRAMEVAGMSAYCDFTEQVSVATDDGRLRPDVLVHLPDKRDMVVDSKVPLNAFLDSIGAENEEQRQACLKRHALAVRDHVKKLSRKEYAAQFDSAPDFVVMFLPGESLFIAALEQDGSLIEDSIKSGVVIATPSTLIALLRAVAYGWQQYEATQNAERIVDVGRELFERVRVFTEHLAKIGDGIRKTTDAYNKAVGSYDTRVRPSGERMSELGSLPSDKTLPEVTPVDTMPTLLPDDRA